MTQEYFRDRISVARRRHNALTANLEDLQRDYALLHPAARHDLHAAGARASMLLICASVLGRNRSDETMRIICMTWLAEYHHAADLLDIVEHRVHSRRECEDADFAALVDRAEDQIRIAAGSLSWMNLFVDELQDRHGREVAKDSFLQKTGSIRLLREAEVRLGGMIDECMEILFRVKEGVSLKKAVEDVVKVEQA